MAVKFYVPKFINIEDKLAGILTFRQLFGLLGAFLLSYFVFKINQIFGFIVALISFGLAILFTFFNINGKPFFRAFPDILKSFMSRKYSWQKIERTVYKEIETPQEIEQKFVFPSFIPKKRKLTGKAAIDFEYKEVAPTIKEKIIFSLEEPIATQIEEINKIIHRHINNPRNPYRLFPYVKFFKIYK